MEEEGIKVTVVGALLIIAAVVVVALVIRALADKGDAGPEQDKANGNDQ
jgi:hypothetical protein